MTYIFFFAMESSVLVAVAVCFFVLIVRRWLSGKRRPPGPLGLPIFGYIPFLSKLPYLDFQKLGKRYGNVFSINMGTQYVVILNDYHSSKDAFAQDAFMGRPTVLPFDFNKETLETNALTGLPWKEQRRFSIHMLRDLGLGKSKMETLMQEEINDLMEHLERNVNKPFSLRDFLGPSMSNNIGALVFGKRFNYDHPVRKMLTHAVNETSRSAAQVSWQVFFPWMKKILQILRIGHVNKLSEIQKELKDYIKQEVEEHIKTLNPNDVRDYIDGYLLEIEKRKGDPTFIVPVLEDMVLGFFIAGSETVRLGLEWLVLMAATHQDAQRRIQQEIDEAVGRHRIATWPDHKNMPFTHAFSMEVMRFRPVVPLNILRYTLANAELNGYFIPKDSFVIANLWAILHNPEYWGNDENKFRPERFLTKDGKDVKKSEYYIPFSIGKRACPGEHLARNEMFLYFTSILQHFNVKLPEGQVENFQGTLGVGLQPITEYIVLTKRN